MNRKRFYKAVDKRSRNEMVSFLTNHFRYNTAGPWNNSTSYANNLKIHCLGFPTDIENKLYDLLEVQEVYDDIAILANDWSHQYHYKWQACFNGRGGGYLVLCQGDLYKSRQQAITYPGRSTDQNEDFAEWDMYSLRERVELIQDFDMLCDNIVDIAVEFVQNYDVVEETICIPQKIKVLQAVN